MIKYFCDRCGEETTEYQTRIRIALRDISHEGSDQRMEWGAPGYQFADRHFCQDCGNKVHKEIWKIMEAHEPRSATAKAK